MAYPELMHYTSAAGLKGILESQCLWATHALFLNDAEEQTVFFDAKLKAVLTLAANALRIDDADQVIDTLASEFTEIIRRTTLKFNQTFVTSLSAPSSPHVAEHGLLSQWRGYGSDGGYAIILDTKQLEVVLGTERDNYDYQHMQFADVYYFNEKAPTEPPPEIRLAEQQLKEVAGQFLAAPGESGMEGAYDAITTLSALYKNFGFHEEREVRIVAIPTHHSAREIDDSPRNLRKAVNTFVRNGCLIPYIALFAQPPEGEVSTRLPITRIVVGPHKDKTRRRDAVEFALSALDIDVEVTTSSIPYIGS